jgi:hypothetical protein
MWAQWDDAVPGFVEIVITVGHVGGNAAEDFCPTLTVTDIPTGWTEMATVKKKHQRCGCTAPWQTSPPGSRSALSLLA